jgi:NADH-quinone oxidoreductase subunit K
MTSQAALVFGPFAVGAVLVMIVGFYSLLSTRNLIRSIIALEVLTKSVTLLIILAGYTTAQQALAQSLAITLIVIEVAVMVVGVGLVLRIHSQTGSIDTNTVENIKG